MATTALVAELLIIGLEAAGWLSLLVLTIFGSDWIDLSGLQGWEALVTIVVIAGAYALGILVDRVADTAHSLARRLFRRGADEPGLGTKRMRVLLRGGEMATFLEYQRSKLRVARATVFNLAAAIPIAPAYLGVRTDARARDIAVVTCLLAVGAALSSFAAHRIEDAFVKRLENADDLVGVSG